jgi:FkbM family methyltransferase
MWIDLKDKVLSYYIFIHGDYEPYETELLEKLTRPGMTVVDVGANMGFYTLNLAKRVGPTGRVYAFEPDPTNRMLLQRGIRLNGLKNVICESAAVMNCEGNIHLYLSQINFGDHRVFESPDYHRAQESDETGRIPVEVPAIILDNYLGGVPVDIVKMDIQGAEWMALAGMHQTLSNKQTTLFFEFWPHGILQSGGDPALFLQTLTNLGFELLEIREQDRKVLKAETAELLERLPHADDAYANLLCVHPEIVQSRIAPILDR